MKTQSRTEIRGLEGLEAALIYNIYNIETPKPPLKAYQNEHVFNVYLCDVGLLNALSDLPPKVFLQGNNLFQEMVQKKIPSELFKKV